MQVVVLDEPLHPPVKVYAPGSVKVTDITSRMYAEREGKLGKDDPMDFMRFEAGFIWEEIAREGLKNRWQRLHPEVDYAAVKPPSYQLDNIWMGPDHLDPNDDYPLMDFKATKTSKKHKFEDKQWYWLPQFMAYAWGAVRFKQVPPEKYGKFKVLVWYINGDYDWDSKMSDYTLLRDYVSLGLTFTMREMKENWQMLLSNGRRYGLLPMEPEYTLIAEEDGPCRPISPSKRSGSPRKPLSPVTTPSTSRTGKILRMPAKKG